MTSTAILDLARAVEERFQPVPEDADEYARRILPPEDLLERLRQRYSAEPVPPCQVCGGELSIQSMGGGQATKYGCPRPEGVTYRDWAEHYDRSVWTQYRAGDSEVIALVDAVEAALVAAGERQHKG